MIWQNPWAWLGLMFLAVPILVHLFARRTSRVQPFPTLRFLTTARPLATRRTRITDPLLLALRLLIIAAAVAALAQPYLLAAGRASGTARTIARAIVVDTSASMRRLTTAGEPALENARREAAAAVAGASSITIIETSTPGDALAGAAAWLETRPGGREIIVLSDFQTGALDFVHLAVVPQHVGVQLRRIGIAPSDAVREHVVQHGAVATVARVSTAGDQTLVEWTRRTGSAVDDGLVLLAGDAERAGADAAVRAARALGAPSLPVARPVAVLFPGYDAHDDVAPAARPLHEPWMGDIAAALARDPALTVAAAHADVSAADELAAAGGTTDANWLVLARTARAAPVVLAAATDDRLVLRLRTHAASSTAAALISALGRAASTAPPVYELESLTLSDTELARWERPFATATTRAAAARDGSHGRWLWLVCLALLTMEAWQRLRTRVDL